LERDRLVEVYPNQGVFVRRQTGKDIQDLFQMRIALEPVAASLAAKNRPADELRAVQEQFDVMARSERQDAGEFVALGASLHDAVIRWTGNQLLAEIYEQLRKQTRLLRNLMQQRVDLESRSFHEHVAILAAIRLQDQGRAEELMRKHLRRTNEDVVGWLAGR
jgi:DNA-binding GntR family transcriptional regulator